MNNRLTVGVVLASLFASSFAQGSPVAEGAKPERLPGDYGFTEGPCADAFGVVYFTDQPNDAIYRIGLDGKVELFLKPCGRSNGMTFARDGSLISCADEKNELWSIDVKSGKHRVIASLPGGKPFNGPNDAYAMDNGGVFLTDPFYQRDWWDHSAMPQDSQAVYYLAPGAAAPIRVATDLSKPNGIAGTPDGKTLYVADIGANKTWRYRIMPGGILGEKTLFCDMGSDGMTVDSAGNLYLTGRGVTVFDPEGKKIGSIPIPENWTANVCFGGSDRSWLYITASKSVYRVRMKTKSARPYGK